ncbi:hypothetical protein VP01_5090g1 [Puccinia sorghi]|uniref:Uncharacterized protein n=1 Tax=Puccinia sorghi TaxID=27349 RepID=A0A0L6UNB2_9BASI|nr:hypothetical protein VP01_5090g1 [Puccinia sorghi]
MSAYTLLHIGKINQNQIFPFLLIIAKLCVIPILVECILFIQNAPPQMTVCDGRPPPATGKLPKITAQFLLSAWKTSIQSMTWKDFQILALKFILSLCSHLIPLFQRGKQKPNYLIDGLYFPQAVWNSPHVP